MKANLYHYLAVYGSVAFVLLITYPGVHRFTVSADKKMLTLFFEFYVIIYFYRTSAVLKLKLV